MDKIRVAIFFGGPSREREISFAGGRTVYDNLDKSIFEVIPIFVDSLKQLILLDWQYIYKGSIRDFYPPVENLPTWGNDYQIYLESLNNLSREDHLAMGAKIGRKIDYGELSQIVDVVFLALHGAFGEDGQIQAILDSMELPYTGSGVLASALGIDKSVQKQWMKDAGFPAPNSFVVKRNDWMQDRKEVNIQSEIKSKLGLHYVIRPANQGSSIGVSILKDPQKESIRRSMDSAFFLREVFKNEWVKLSKEEKRIFITDLCDIRSGIGLPAMIGEQKIYHPERLSQFFDEVFMNDESVLIEAIDSEQKVLLEAFINGREFSCIVVRKEDGSSLALPPTEIIKGNEVYDYRSKYLPGLSRKLTPIDLEITEIEKIQSECEKLFELFQFETYARIDGFYNNEGIIFLNDPNTTSGMLPSSFFFHQAAELGLNPSQLLSFIIRQSLQERRDSSNTLGLHQKLIDSLDVALAANVQADSKKKRIGVILGGYSSERHISVESGRNIFEKLASSGIYEAIPIFLSRNEGGFIFHQLPINLLLKDNADDIIEKLKNYKKHPFLQKLRENGKDIIQKYSSSSAVLDPVIIEKTELKHLVDGVFIALHGRPGEDGELQRFLETEGIAYNGSGPDSSSITINKYDTLQLLKSHGFIVAEQALVHKSTFIQNKNACLDSIESQFNYPFIAKPVDDGCSSAVVLVKSREQLDLYLTGIFRDEELGPDLRTALGLKMNEEFPQKNEVLIEERIDRKDADHFLEITGGLLTKYENSHKVYEVFEPSEALAGEEILSLEEKFLAGEGQNITPARFANNDDEFRRISKQVRSDLERAAKILNVEGYARIDAFVRIFKDRVETIIIEINSLPGMTPATCIFHQTALNGYKPFDFIDRILKFGFEKNKLAELTSS